MHDAPPGTARLRTRAFPSKAGAPSPNVPRGWYSRGYLPYFDTPDVIQHVTFRLADSLPKDVVERLMEKIKHLEPA